MDSVLNSSSGISASSARASSPGDLEFPGDIDLLMLASSWDARSVEIRKCNLGSVKRCAVLLFDNQGELGLRDLHDGTLRDFAGSVSLDPPREIHGRSEDIGGIWTQIRECLGDLVFELGRPLTVAVDLSACPRVFSLGLLAFGFRRGLIRSATVFYSVAAKYETDTPTMASPHLFTRGSWTPHTIPGLHGHVDTTGGRHVVASIGFEGAKIKRAVGALEPAGVSLLYPIPPNMPEFEAVNRNAGRSIERDFHVDDGNVFTAPASDAVAAWRVLRDLPTELMPLRRSAVLLCCGTKPHSLGMMLTALENPALPAFFMQPGSHREVPVTPKFDEYWQYQIVDRRNSF